jgi:translation initiation factor 2B subunit (eIF-2B alpha/beta/delta family)
LRYPKETLVIIKCVRTDRTTGAIGLAIKGLDAFKPLGSVLDCNQEMLKGVSRRLLKARPTMVCIGNASSEVFCRVVDRGGEGEIGRAAAAEAEKMQRKLVLSKASIANAFMQYVSKPVVVLTLSDSQTVLEALRRIKEQLAQVFITVSDPGGEGKSLSGKLSAEGIRNILVPDMVVGSIMPKVDIVLLGADAVLSDGSVVNKLGSNTAAKIAYVEGKQVFFLAEGIKVHPSDEEVTLELDMRSAQGGYQPRFDITPYGYVQHIIWEEGELDLERIKTLAARHAESRSRVRSAKQKGMIATGP